jgi:hypothetical protein
MTKVLGWGLLLAGLTPGEARAESPWLLDAGLGTVRLESSDFRFSGDATAGYATPTLGVVASGFVSYYDITKNNQISDFFRAGGNGEVWYLTNNRSKGLHFEIRASGGGALYSSDNLTGGILEDSVFGRGTLMVGLKADPDENFSLEFIGGGGGQLEAYNREDFSSRTSTALQEQQTFTFRGEGRLAVRWAFLPGTLATRLKASAQTFRLTRSTATLVASDSAQTVAQAEETLLFRQNEASGRLFVDLVAASFAGITPGVFGGFDYVGVSGTAGSNTVFLPTFGVGLFKDAFLPRHGERPAGDPVGPSCPSLASEGRRVRADARGLAGPERRDGLGPRDRHDREDRQCQAEKAADGTTEEAPQHPRLLRVHPGLLDELEHLRGNNQPLHGHPEQHEEDLERGLSKQNQAAPCLSFEERRGGGDLDHLEHHFERHAPQDPPQQDRLRPDGLNHRIFRKSIEKHQP